MLVASSSHGGLEVELWTNNSLPSALNRHYSNMFIWSLLSYKRVLKAFIYCTLHIYMFFKINQHHLWTLNSLSKWRVVLSHNKYKPYIPFLFSEYIQHFYESLAGFKPPPADDTSYDADSLLTMPPRLVSIRN